MSVQHTEINWYVSNYQTNSKKYLVASSFIRMLLEQPVAVFIIIITTKKWNKLTKIINIWCANPNNI